MTTMGPLWLCLCCLAAWPAPGRSASEAPPTANGNEELFPEQFPVEFSQHEVIPDGISQEFLIQKILEKLDHEKELPILIHGEPQPFQPRGKKPPCREVGCTRRAPLYRLGDFPPARPSLSNLGALCSEGRKRSSYGPWSLPQSSFSHLSRQGEALSQLETQFGRCCHLSEDQRLPCASNEWEKCLTRFCKQEFSTKTRPFHCCRARPREARFACFAGQAPFPAYEGEGPSLDLANLTSPFLDSVCSQASAQDRQGPSPALIQNITDSCCKLQGNDRAACAEGVKSHFISAVCGSQKRGWKDPQKCCAQEGEAKRTDCFNSNYLRHVPVLGSQQEEEEEEEVPLPTQKAP